MLEVSLVISEKINCHEYFRSYTPTDIGDRMHMFRRREVAVCFSPMSMYIPNILAALHDW